MEVSALAVAIVSLVLSAVAIGWQVANYLLTGVRVKVETRYGALAAGGLVSWDRPPAEWELQQLGEYGPVQPLTVVRVRNVGRATTSVESVGVDVGGGTVFQQLSGLPNPELPHRLEGQSAQSFMLDAQEVAAGRRAAQSSGIGGKGDGRLRGVATLGSGREVKDRRGIK